MARNVVVVESPAKAKTIDKYLGKDFEILASYGHVRDLVPKEGAVDPEHGYAMKYEIIHKNEKHVDAIARAVKKAKALYLATDPDREGEAISWHLAEILKERGVLDGREVHRVVFYEITEREIHEAMHNPREVSADLVNAQQARRALDYLVGFNLSPLLWKKVQPKLSAGRVQSPALRLICEREDEIEAFKAQEYWTIEADLSVGASPFTARLAEFRGEKVEQFTFGNDATASAAREALLAAAQRQGTRLRHRAQAAAPQPGSAVHDVHAAAGSIPQARLQRAAHDDDGTASVRRRRHRRRHGRPHHLHAHRLGDARHGGARPRSGELIAERFGKDNLPDEPRYYKTIAKNAQEAHEGIRPTSVDAHARSPAAVPERRAVPALRPDLEAHGRLPDDSRGLRHGHGRPRARGGARRPRGCARRGSTLVVPGFIAVYQEGRDDSKDDEQRSRAAARAGGRRRQRCRRCRREQHFTEPPPRYSDATLVKALEEYGIGRPSTYASIISTLRTATTSRWRASASSRRTSAGSSTGS